MSTEKSNYVYALKDGRENPAKIFYIGKGSGIRKEDHLLNIDKTTKGKFINEIITHGGKVIVSVLSDELTEYQALKLEAEMISAFGIEKHGGMLKNSVSPNSKKQNEEKRYLFSRRGIRCSALYNSGP